MHCETQLYSENVSYQTQRPVTFFIYAAVVECDKMLLATQVMSAKLPLPVNCLQLVSLVIDNYFSLFSFYTKLLPVTWICDSVFMLLSFSD